MSKFPALIPKSDLDICTKHSACWLKPVSIGGGFGGGIQGPGKVDCNPYGAEGIFEDGDVNLLASRKQVLIDSVTNVIWKIEKMHWEEETAAFENQSK